MCFGALILLRESGIGMESRRCVADPRPDWYFWALTFCLAQIGYGEIEMDQHSLAGERESLAGWDPSVR